MNILITGGLGFLGWRTAKRLALIGNNVTVASRTFDPEKDLLTDKITFRKMDLQNEQEVLDACRKQDIIVHCGALSSPWGRYEEFYKTNVLGTKHVIKGCVVHDVKRMIHISTPSIYFDFNNRLNIKEEDPLPKKACNAYAQTKLLAELEIDKAFKEGLKVVTLRPRGIFGPGDTTIFPRLIEANRKQGLPLINGGLSLIDLTYVENVVDAILLSITSSDSILGKKFNITNDEPWTALNLMKCLFDKLDEQFHSKQLNYYLAYSVAWGMELISKYIRDYKEPTFTRYSVGVISKSQTLDIHAAKQELGYCPSISIQQGLSFFAKWWKEKEAYENGC